MWIKICGMTSAAAVHAAVGLGVDAIGFVFAESPRRLTPQSAARLAQPVRGRVCCVAVMRHPTQTELDEIVTAFSPDLLQTDAADFGRLRLPAGVGRLPVVRAGEAVPAALPARILFEGPVSGTGVAVDWHAAAKLARRTQLVLAGGLNSGNVAAAIGAVRPYGVDVSSGVEAQPGVKSPAEIVKFVAAVRAAAPAAASFASEGPP
jgi:phosphoribosylanthranilate isomerase